MTDYDIFGNSVVLLGCLAKPKRTINGRVQERLDVEQLHHLGTVFAKEDRETGKVVQKPCLFVRRNSTVAASATLSRDKVAATKSHV